MIDQVLKLSLELDTRILDELFVFSLEPLSTVFCLESRYYVSKVLELSKEALVLTSALNCSPSADKLGHLFEDFASPKFQNDYLRWSLSLRVYLL